MAELDLIERLTHGWRAYVVIALLSLCASLPGVFRVPPLDRDESRYAQASLQMLETHDFVRIAVQDQPRNKKPAGIHWMQAASVSLFSSTRAHEIWAYRLPSVLGALIASLAAFWGGTALIGRRAAFAGAALLACSLLLSTEGMIAKTDAALCGFTTLAMAALAQLRMRPEFKPRVMALMFWAALSAGILIKGPITPLVAGLCLAALALWERKAAWMRALLYWPAIALGALIALPWLVAIGIETHGKFFADAISGDLGRKLGGGDEGHAAPFGFHTLLVWLLLFPATIALPAALLRGWQTIRAPRADDSHTAMRFLIAWAVPLWIVFEVLPTKLPHYVLPAYPALALLCGAALIDVFDREKTPLRLTARSVTIAGLIVLIALSCILATYMPGDAQAAHRRALTAGIVGALLLAPALFLVWRARAAGLLVLTACAAMIVFDWSARERTLPEARSYFVSAEASNALMRAGLHPRLSPGAGKLTAIGYNEPSLVFLTRTDTLLLPGAPAGAEVRDGDGVLIEGRERASFEAAIAARGLSFAPIGDAVTGVNYSNGDDTSLQPGRIISSAPGTAP